jgi:membrane protease YdiL (CAAX protease family)
MSRKAIALFCALALALSWGIQFTGLHLFGMASPTMRNLMVGGMWSPTLLALAFIALHKPARQGVAWRLGNPFYLPVGIVAQGGLAFVIVAVFTALGWGASGWFVFSAQGVAVSGGPWVLGLGAQGWPLFVLNVVATGAAYSVFGLIAATGEEFAWRGFLQGHVIRRFGVTGGIVLIGLFWAAWHLPILLAGYNFPQYPVLGALVLFPVQLVAASFFFGWLTLRSGSFWPAALAHAATNSIQEGVIANLHLNVPLLWLDLSRTGLLVVIGLACLLALRRNNPVGSALALP